MDTLQNIRQSLVISVCLLAAVPMLFCLGSWFCTSPRRRSLYATLNRQFRSLPPGGKLLAVVFLATFIAMGSTKTNNAPPPSPPPGGIVFDDGLQMEPDGEGFLSEGFWGPRLTTNQYRAGFALVRVVTNAAPFSLIPTNALAESYWTRYGVAEDTFWLPATNWAFTLGTNQVEGLHVSSSGTLTFVWPKGSPRAREMPDGSQLDFLAPLQTTIGIVPPVGRFWHAPTSSNSLLLTWQDVYLNRDTNYPITFQSELFQNGDFTFRYAFTNSHTPTLPHALTNFVIGAQHNNGGETYAFGDTNSLVNGLELRWRAFGLLDSGIDDHDGDGLSTYDEVMDHGSDPHLYDTDFDGLSDPDELTAGTDPRNPDSDGDGLADGIDPQPLVWNDPNADADNDGYPLWEELLYGTSDAVPGDVAQHLANGSRQVTFTIVGTPSPGTMLAINGRPLLLAGRTAFSLALPNGSFTLLALDNAPDAAVRTTSPDCIVLMDCSGGLAPGATGTGTATLVLPVLTIGSGGSICLHEANQMITANVTAGLPGYYDWQWNGGSYYGGPVISSSGIQPDWIAVWFWPDNGNGNCCVASEGLSQCRRIYCNHGLLAWECGICTGGSGEAWCGLHDDWKCRCACLTVVGGGMLAPGGETVCMFGDASDSCENHVHYEHCCDCIEHLGGGWSWAEAKTNIIRQVSTRLDVVLDGTQVAENRKLIGPKVLSVGGAQLSETFGDARIIASHELHPSDTVTSAWTVASIGLEPATYAEGRFLIRGGTGCVSYVTVFTDSALTEGSLWLYAGATGLCFSETEDEALVDAQALRTDTPPGSVGAYRDFWLGTAAGGSHTLNYSLRTPQGAVCLATNLAIEAIVAKFATNVCYAAFGATSGVVVALSSASHDPAGYTLRLNGSVCATGQPPWLIAVSNLTAGAHTLTVQSETFPDVADEAALYVIKVSLVPDYDRDGVIGALDKARAATNEVFRFWINDDDDNGTDISEGNDDVPGQGYGVTTESNDTQWPDSATVDGRCDLLDFFPVWLDLENLFSALPANTAYTIRLSQTDSALRAVYTDLSAAQAGVYLVSAVEDCGAGVSQAAHEADSLLIEASGVQLAQGFVARLAADQQKGVLMVEGRAATQNPLVLEVFCDNTRIVLAEMPLRVSPVEEFYRWINLRPDAASHYPSRTNEPPNRPDGACLDKTVFLTHGFLVTRDQARGWASEGFKRLYQAGMNARFCGVSWHSDQGMSADYYLNVQNARSAALQLAPLVNAIPGEKVWMAHSLGNMLSGYAIADYGMDVEKYFALNAAVAAECYDMNAVDETESMSNYMRHENWDGYSNRTWSAKWHGLFLAGDDRAKLTWRHRFTNVLERTQLYNFWSSGDEVLEIANGTPYISDVLLGTLDIFDILDIDTRQYVWHKQELYKGRNLIYGTGWAGWGFESNCTASAANATPVSVLRDAPIFEHDPACMFTNVISQTNFFDNILIKGIPSLSWPLGRRAITINGESGRNIDMNNSDLSWRPNGWPWGESKYQERWLHSQLIYVAHHYTHKLYETFIDIGGLK